jgi:DNA-binding NarL/FixJ family response regulator
MPATDTKAIRLLLVEDHVLLREALARSLAAESGFVIAGQCSGVDEAIQIVTTSEVDVVLLDINLGSEQGTSFMSRARSAGYRGLVLVVTAGVSDREAAWLVHRGCAGIFLKNQGTSELAARIRGVVSGTVRMDPVSVKAVLSQLHAPENTVRRALTARESEVLRHVCGGLTNKEIALKLGISESSVKSFLQQLFTKTGVRSRAGLVAAAIEQYWDEIQNS